MEPPIPDAVVQQVIISNRPEGAPFGKGVRGHILPLRSFLPARGMHHFPQRSVQEHQTFSFL